MYCTHARTHTQTHTKYIHIIYVPIHTCTTDESSHEEWLLPNEEVHSREVGEEHVQDDKEESPQPVWWTGHAIERHCCHT